MSEQSRYREGSDESRDVVRRLIGQQVADARQHMKLRLGNARKQFAPKNVRRIDPIALARDDDCGQVYASHRGGDVFLARKQRPCLFGRRGPGEAVCDDASRSSGLRP